MFYEDVQTQHLILLVLQASIC